jgi:carboxylesterase type B
MKAPLGKLRFRDAELPEKWTEPLDTTGARPTYTGYSLLSKEVEGQEDAGILTVAAPYLDRKLPVAVYIHGGGFQKG